MSSILDRIRKARSSAPKPEVLRDSRAPSNASNVDRLKSFKRKVEALCGIMFDGQGFRRPRSIACSILSTVSGRYAGESLARAIRANTGCGSKPIDRLPD